VGDEQLAGHRQLLQQRQGGIVNAVRRPGSDGLFGMAKPVRAPQIGPARQY